MRSQTSLGTIPPRQATNLNSADEKMSLGVCVGEREAEERLITMKVIVNSLKGTSLLGVGEGKNKNKEEEERRRKELVCIFVILVMICLLHSLFFPLSAL